MEIKNVIGDRVFLKDLQVFQKPGQKIIEIEYNEMLKHGEVAYCGDEVKDIKPGDRVVLMLPCGVDVPFNGQDYKVVRRSDIWFVADGVAS